MLKLVNNNSRRSMLICIFVN